MHRVWLPGQGFQRGLPSAIRQFHVPIRLLPELIRRQTGTFDAAKPTARVNQSNWRRSHMMHSITKLAKTRLAAAAVVTAAAIAASTAVLGQSCPATGCAIPGITVPNGLTICPGTGTNAHNPAQFSKGTQLCNSQPID